MKIKVTGSREFEVPELVESLTYNEADGARCSLRGPTSQLQVVLTFTSQEARATAAKLIEGSMFKGHEPDPDSWGMRQIRDASDERLLNMTVRDFLAWVKASELQAESRIACLRCHARVGKLHKPCNASGCECICNP